MALNLNNTPNYLFEYTRIDHTGCGKEAWAFALSHKKDNFSGFHAHSVSNSQFKNILIMPYCFPNSLKHLFGHKNTGLQRFQRAQVNILPLKNPPLPQLNRFATLTQRYRWRDVWILAAILFRRFLFHLTLQLTRQINIDRRWGVWGVWGGSSAEASNNQP